MARGEKYLSKMENVRAARRDNRHPPGLKDFIVGFRPARTWVAAIP
jgi:hypothetical protein